MKVALHHPANAGIVRHLSAGATSAPTADTARSQPSLDPARVNDPYLNLGTHPDLVARLWDEITTSLPHRCAWVVFGAPVLVHPDSGILFGFAGGSHTYALRLPPPEREHALRLGARRVWNYPAYPELGITASVLNLDEIGPEWVFGGWYPPEKDWCLAAYRMAGAVDAAV